MKNMILNMSWYLLVHTKVKLYVKHVMGNSLHGFQKAFETDFFCGKIFLGKQNQNRFHFQKTTKAEKQKYGTSYSNSRK